MNPHRILLAAWIVPMAAALSAQSTPADYTARQREKVSAYHNRQNAKVEAFRDSMNREHARFLEARWEAVNLHRRDMGFKPMPAPPVYAPKPQPSPLNPQPSTKKNPHPPTPEPQPTPTTAITADFFGVPLQFHDPKLRVSRPADTSEKSVAKTWRELSAMRIERLLDDYSAAASTLGLDDWGTYQLISHTAQALMPDSNPNLRVVWTVFILNQMGYKAKIGRSDGNLYALIASTDPLYNISHFTGSPDRYYVMNPGHHSLNRLETCPIDFKGGTRTIAIRPPKRWPRLGDDLTSTARYMATYPCMDYDRYVTAPSLLPDDFGAPDAGLSHRESVAQLLSLLQHSLKYKTDSDNYGYEKWNFPEETLVEEFCDCEDRAILFCRLVRTRLGLDVALVYYPGLHLAAAVKITPAPGDTVVRCQGADYVLCDPTYIGAPIGQEMPTLIGTDREIIAVGEAVR